MSSRLLINPGTPQAWEIELKPGVNRIGRGTENDFTINHGSISTNHCEITVTDTAVFLKDLGSTNGTFVERVPVTEIQLYPGQHVQFGAVDMRFESDLAPVLPEAINQPAAGGRIISANPGPAAPPPPAPVGGPRINRPPPSGFSAPPTPTSVPVRPISTADRTTKTPLAAIATADLPAEPKLVRGIIGAVVGGAIGIFIWSFLIKITGREFGFIAWGVGVIVGFGGRIPSPRGSHTLGMVCGICALIAILGGQYFALIAFFDDYITEEASKKYRGEMQVAQTAVNAKTREEIIQFIAGQNKRRPVEITETDIAEFQEKALPEYQDFVNGKPTREDYIQETKTLSHATIPKAPLFKKNIGVLTLLWIALGVGTAWKIGAGVDD